MAAPTCLQLFLIFSRIALSSFGGGLSGWLFREFVEDRKWLSEAEYFDCLSIAQALPGVNVCNMAIWIGFHLLGFRGAVASLAAVIVPPAIVIVLLGTVFASLSTFDLTHVVLDGAAAAAVGLSGSMGIRTALRVPRRIVPVTTMAATFLAVGVFRWPLFETFAIVGTASIAHAYLSE